MGKIIKLKSRYSHHKLIELLPCNGGESKTYILKLEENSPIRVGYSDDGKQWIDPPGGPFMSVGGMIDDNKIKNIDYSYDLGGYIITFE